MLLLLCVVLAHLMRSVGGGYDNESVAVSCLCLTFLCWAYSISGTRSKTFSIFGVFTGLAYVCMAATWGGFIFVLNMIGLHAFVLFLLGRYTTKLYSAYTLWYIVGTLGAIQVPVIGYGPLKSLEQLAPCGVFLLFQFIQLSHSSFVLKWFGYDKKWRKLKWSEKLTVYSIVFGAGGVIILAVILYLWPRGYFGPLSSRIRGLFVAHTRTGNPLVDSVAEHQPANQEAFFQFLHNTYYTAPVGFAIAALLSVLKPIFKSDRVTGRASQDPLLFVVVYALVTYTFSTKMNRLMLMMGPVSAVLSGVAFGVVLDFVMFEVQDLFDMIVGLCFSDDDKKKKKTKSKEDKATEKEKKEDDQEVIESTVVNDKETPVKNRKKNKKNGTPSNKKKEDDDETKSNVEKDNDKDDKGIIETIETLSMKFWSFSLIRLLRKAAAVACVYYLNENRNYADDFYNTSKEMSYGLSHPSIMFQATLRDGTEVMVDDYREAYWWLRDNTPEDSRVLAWWDYGYQITGIGNDKDLDEYY